MHSSPRLTIPHWPIATAFTVTPGPALAILHPHAPWLSYCLWQGLERRAPGAAHAVPGMWLNDLDLLSCSSSELLSRPTWDTLGPEVVLSALPTFAEVPQWALP